MIASATMDQDQGVKFGELKEPIHQEMATLCISFQDVISTQLQKLAELMQDNAQQQEDHIADALSRLKKIPGQEATSITLHIAPPASSAAFLAALARQSPEGGAPAPLMTMPTELASTHSQAVVPDL